MDVLRDQKTDFKEIIYEKSNWVARITIIAWCTGGAQGYFEQAIATGVDCFVSGEVSEQTTHLARESGVAYLAIGHHASERYGVQALGAHLARTDRKSVV